METRDVPRLNRNVTVVGLGTWQLGADWGDVDAGAADEVLETAYARGVRFFDTVDVYGDGRSERFCAELRERHPDAFVATKMGRRHDQTTENYSRENFLAWNDRSLRTSACRRLTSSSCTARPTACTPTTRRSMRSTRWSPPNGPRVRGVGGDL